MKKVKVGIVGTGVGIRTHYNGFKPLDDAEVVAICGSSAQRSEEFASMVRPHFTRLLIISA